MGERKHVCYILIRGRATYVGRAACVREQAKVKAPVVLQRFREHLRLFSGYISGDRAPEHHKTRYSVLSHAPGDPFLCMHPLLITEESAINRTEGAMIMLHQPSANSSCIKKLFVPRKRPELRRPTRAPDSRPGPRRPPPGLGPDPRPGPWRHPPGLPDPEPGSWLPGFKPRAKPRIRLRSRGLRPVPKASPWRDLPPLLRSYSLDRLNMQQFQGMLRRYDAHCRESSSTRDLVKILCMSYSHSYQHFLRKAPIGPVLIYGAGKATLLLQYAMGFNRKVN